MEKKLPKMYKDNSIFKKMEHGKRRITWEYV